MTTPDGLVHALRRWPGFLDRVARTATRISDLAVPDQAEEDDAAEPQERPGAEPELPLPDED